MARRGVVLGVALLLLTLPSCYDEGGLAGGRPKPVISASPESVAFQALEGGPLPADQELSISNAGTGTLNWSASVAYGGPGTGWLTLDPITGSSTGETDTVTLSVDHTGLAVTSHTASITISDPLATNNPVIVQVTLEVSAPVAPAITSAAVTAAEVDAAYSYDVEATGTPAPTYSLTVSPTGMTIDSATGVVSWTPAAGQSGVHDVTVEAANFAGTDQQAFQVTVDEAPAITSTAVTTGEVGVAYSYDVDATGCPAPTYSLSTSPAGMTIDSATGVISWTPAAGQGGAYDVTVTASNGVGSDDAQSFQVTVNEAPTITTAAVTTGKVGVAYSYDVDATGYPAPTYSLSTSPAGMTIDSATGVVSWTPAAGQEGDSPVTVVASNGVGADATQPFTVTVSPAGNVWYVVPGGAGAQDGSSWTDAFDDPQDAVNAASAGHEVWVAAGTYTNDNVGDGTTTVLVMKDGVSIYGGFAGTESLRTDRDPAAHETILDGEDTAYHVVLGASNATLDGFTITRGNANGSSPNNRGGGMLNESLTNLTVADCVFSASSAADGGGGMHNYSCSPAVTSCTFTGNTATDEGGGMFNWTGSSPAVTGCAFSGNSADFGAGMANKDSSSPQVSDCAFLGNSASWDAGGMGNYKSSPTVTGCVFSGNSGYDGGGMINWSDSSPVVTNCAFAQNTADNRGGGVLCINGGSAALTSCTFSGNSATALGGGVGVNNCLPVVTNCVLWGNTAPSGPDLRVETGSCDVSRSCVGQGIGFTDAGGNIDLDPMFVDSAAGIFALRAGSPCIDAADGDQAPATDINGYARYDDPDTEPNTGVGTVSGVTWADMGAYEYQGAGVSLTVTSPNGGETWTRGQEYTVTWTPTGLGGNVRIEVGHMGTDPVAMPEGEWTGTTDTAGALCPSPRQENSAVWTGTRMIVWGGTDAGYFDTGALYDPATDTWEAETTTTGLCPEPRYAHSAVWTGSRMIIWGGNDTWLDTGRVYDPATDTWESATSTSAPCPSARRHHSAVWTGAKIVVWGGYRGSKENTGAHYDPATDTWGPTTSTGGACPTGRNSHTAVWTGRRMIVWGGHDGSGRDNGALYDPSTNTWPVSTSAAGACPTARWKHDAVWTGSRMIVWGGFDVANTDTGAIYDEPTDTWETTTATFGLCPSGREARAVWTGTRMLVWGGTDGTRQNTGAFYNPPGWHKLAVLAESTPDDGSFTVTSDVTKDLWVGREYRVRIVHLGSGAEDMSDNDMTISAGGGPGVWHVNSHVTLSGDGSCWLEAMKNPQEAVDAAFAAGGGEVWVQAGTYDNTYNGGGTNSVLVMKDDVHIYGGLAGWESARSERCLAARESVLDGEDTAYHVVIGASNATLDGFTVTNGNATGTDLDNDAAGMLNYMVSSLSVCDCVFRANTSSDSAGAIANHTSTALSFTNCIISNNTATREGGAIRNLSSTTAAFTCCTVVANSATEPNGDGICNSDSIVTLTNCVVRNGGTDEIYDKGGTSLTVTYSNVQGGQTGTGNIDLDPLFVDAAGGDFRLQAGSPCIDTGTIIGAPSTDIEGNLRPQGGGVDMGAYERAAANVWHVDDSVAASGDGTSWAQAFKTVQEGNAAASAGDEVWVADGTYTNNGGGTATVLVMNAGIGYFGGFAGTETDRAARDPEINVTTLDGLDTAYHVVEGASNATLDGFTVTRGNANGGGAVESHGGGICCDAVSPTIVGTRIVGNVAAGRGGGVFCRTSNSSLANCILAGNQGGTEGGGLSNWDAGDVSMDSCVFTGNSATVYGGAIRSKGSSLTLANCTVAVNSAGDTCGGVDTDLSSTLVAENCIIWGNTDIAGSPNVYTYTSTAEFGHSAIQGCGGSGGGWTSAMGTDNGGNIDLDPLFVDAADPDGPDDIWGTADDGLRLQPGSPCIDSADGDAAPAMDILGNARHDDLGVTDTGVGAVTYADMGAYEFQDDSTGTYKIVDLTTGAVTDAGTVGDLLTNDAYKTTKLVLKRIEAGTFQMGDEVGGHDADELPVHTVNITQPFYVGVFELTQMQWQTVTGSNPSYFTGYADSPRRPVEQVSWDDCQTYVTQISTLTGATFRLPTEAEWEYCCKAGTSTNWSNGDTEDGAWMWYNGNSVNQAHEVATTTSKPNPWGLCDMHGNVDEWCEDWVGAYSSETVSDPTGPAGGTNRVVRGGAYHSSGSDCRSSVRRVDCVPSASDWFRGLRVVLDPQDVVTRGLVGHWKFDETSGTTAADSSGNGSDGTLVNMAGTEWTTGKIGGALAFTKDVRDYVETLNTDNLDSPVTFSFWVKFSTVNIASGVVSGFQGGEPNSWSLMLLQWSATDNIWWVENATPGGTSTTTVFQADTWYHLAVVHDLGSGTVDIYTDGALDGTGPVTLNLQTGIPLCIGDGPASSAFHGVIDDVRVYDRALSAAEIQALHQAGQ